MLSDPTAHIRKAAETIISHTKEGGFESVWEVDDLLINPMAVCMKTTRTAVGLANRRLDKTSPEWAEVQTAFSTLMRYDRAQEAKVLAPQFRRFGPL